MSIFSSNLECVLQNLGMSQRELAERAGMTQSAISQIISGDREPMVSTLLKLCCALKLTPNELLDFHSESHLKTKLEVLELRLKINRAIKILQK